MIDFRKERARLGKEAADLDAQLKGLQARLANQDFVRRAPPEEVRKARDLCRQHLAKRRRLLETLESLS
ncbi:MAG: hypothetical protein HY551_01345 [Elusimicrobia bacterium]|nr:hypothetical protein [Elusimicrobiota bacterium]